MVKPYNTETDSKKEEARLIEDARLMVLGLSRLAARAKALGIEMDLSSYTSGDRFDINFKRVMVDFDVTVSTDDISALGKKSNGQV